MTEKEFIEFSRKAVKREIKTKIKDTDTTYLFGLSEENYDSHRERKIYSVC